MTGTDDAGGGWLPRVLAASGAAAVVLFAAGLLFADLLGSDNYPALDAPTGVMRRYFVENAAEVRALSFFHTLSALALLAFSVELGRRIRRADGGGARGPLATAGGITAAGFLLLSALSYRTLAEPAVAREPALAHSLLVLSYLAGGPAISVPLSLPLGAGAALALRGTLLPRWTGWLGAAAAVVSLASAVVLLGPTDNRSAAYGILLLGAVLGFGWVVVASVLLTAKRAPRGGTASAPRS